MIPKNRIPTHPGEILQEEFLNEMGITQDIGVPVQRINEIIRRKRGATSDTAWLLAQAFDTTPEFWLNLQAAMIWP